jgi:hypothetical protein
MANNLNVNPAVFTTTSGSYKAAVSASQGTFLTVLVEKIYFFNPNAVGDTALITDPNTGETLLRLRCEVANQSQLVDWTAKPKRWADFAVPELDSGTLYVYFA